MNLLEAVHRRVNDRPGGFGYTCYCPVCCAIRSGAIAIDVDRLAQALHDSQPCPLRKCVGMACPRLPFLADWARKAVEWEPALPLVSAA